MHNNFSHDCNELIRPIITDRVAWSVGWSVCLSLTLCEPCKNGSTDRDVVWAEDSGGSKEPCIRWGSRSRNMGIKGQF